MKTALPLALLLATSPLALLDEGSGCGGEDPHSSPDAHACHHAAEGTLTVVATSAPAQAPTVTTTQEAHSAYTVELPATARGYGGYVRFTGLVDGDTYVVFWSGADVTPTLTQGGGRVEIPPSAEADGAEGCDAFDGRNEYPVGAGAYELYLESSRTATVSLTLEALSQYP